MPRKAFNLILFAVMLCGFLFSGCGIQQDPTLPSIDIERSTLSGTVEYVNENTCLLQLTSEDSHFDEEDNVYVTYVKVGNDNPISVGDEITFSYHYTKDVSEYNGEPHIAVDEVSVK